MQAASRALVTAEHATARQRHGGGFSPKRRQPFAMCPPLHASTRSSRSFLATSWHKPPESAFLVRCSASQSPAPSANAESPVPNVPSGKSVRRSTWDPFDDAVARVINMLSHDFPLIYKHSMDYSVLSEDIIFVDPVVRSEGRLNYWGMMESLKLMAMGFHNPTFDVISLEEVEPSAVPEGAFQPNKVGKVVETVRALRMKWSTEGTSVLGGKLYMSGDDILRIGHDGKISVHESSWHQDPADVLKKMVNAEWN